MLEHRSAGQSPLHRRGGAIRRKGLRLGRAFVWRVLAQDDMPLFLPFVGFCHGDVASYVSTLEWWLRDAVCKDRSLRHRTAVQTLCTAEVVRS